LSYIKHITQHYTELFSSFQKSCQLFKYFKRFPNKKQQHAYLYFISLSNTKESFYKIGITTQSINERIYYIRKQTNKKYDIKIIESSDGTLYQMWNLEQEMLNKMFVHLLYTPTIKFNGYTECFKLYEK
jgi:hypothetical protein